jgi:hypothetical protein
MDAQRWQEEIVALSMLAESRCRLHTAGRVRSSADFPASISLGGVRQRRSWIVSRLRLNDIFETKRHPRDLSIRTKFVFPLRKPRRTGGGYGR